jgi:3-hydroxyisobutyrate dehydrogenase-like beta-hydroxyacid dehydrogenase
MLFSVIDFLFHVHLLQRERLWCCFILKKEDISMEIGVVGLGIMGSGMSSNLLKKGHDVIIYNRSRQKAEALIANGAKWADSPAEIAKRVSVIITMLAKPDVVAEMALHKERGFLNHLKVGSLWIDCSTVNPSFSKRMASEAHQRKVKFLDAPVTGSKSAAQQGQLGFFVGGEKADLDEARPIFEAMGKTIIHVGGHGMGASMKIVNNLMVAQAVVAYSEGIVLGLSLGIPRDFLFNAIANSTVFPPVLATRRVKIETGTFDPDFHLKWMYKDLQLASETAYETGVAMPATNVVKEIFALAMRDGLGEEDLSAVFKVLSEKK